MPQWWSLKPRAHCNYYTYYILNCIELLTCMHNSKCSQTAVLCIQAEAMYKEDNSNTMSTCTGIVCTWHVHSCVCARIGLCQIKMSSSMMQWSSDALVLEILLEVPYILWYRWPCKVKGSSLMAVYYSLKSRSLTTTVKMWSKSHAPNYIDMQQLLLILRFSYRIELQDIVTLQLHCSFLTYRHRPELMRQIDSAHNMPEGLCPQRHHNRTRIAQRKLISKAWFGYWLS